MDENSKHEQAPPGWIKALEASEAEFAAGLTVSIEPVMRRLRESIARMEAQQGKTIASGVTSER
jgi:hypothetical protein